MGTKRSDRLSPSQVSMLCALLIAALPALASAAPASPPTASAGAAAHGADAPAPPAGAVAQPQPVKSGEAAASCEITPLQVAAAYREVATPAPKGTGAPSAADAKTTTSQDLQLGDVLTVKVPGLSGLMAQLAKSGCKGKKLALYLDGRPIPDLVAYPPTDPANSQEILYFVLTPTGTSREAWAYLMGSPGWDRRPTAVSVGLADGYAFPSDSQAAIIQLAVIPHDRFCWWALLFGAMLIGFLVLAAKSDVLRDAGPPPGYGARRPFSLSRTQAAWWFFIILGSYLLIGLVTGNVLSSITGSVLVLLGISAGTVVGAAAVDAGQQKPDSQARQADAQAQLTVQVAQAGATLQNVKLAHDGQVGQVTQAAELARAAQAAQVAAPADPAAAQVAQAAQEAHALQTAQAARTTAVVTAATAALAEKRSQLKAARNETENFLLDILSDADGVNFHRFQNAAWTIVLGIIFAGLVYRELAMPQFDGTLLALMGISAGTYLGMKIPEPKVPTITP